MKKHSNWLLLAVLTIIILALPGCSFGSASATPSATAFPTATEIPSPTLSPTATLSPTPSASPTPTLSPREALLESLEKATGGDLYRVGFSTDETHKRNDFRLFRTKNGLMSVDYQLKSRNENPVVFDMKTGKIVEGTENLKPISHGIIGLADEETVYRVNTSNGEWVLYDLSLTEITRFTIEDGIFELGNPIYIDGKRSEVYFWNRDDSLCIYNYEKNSRITVHAPERVSGFSEIFPIGNNTLGITACLLDEKPSEDQDFVPCIARFDLNGYSFIDYLSDPITSIYKSPDGKEDFLVVDAPYVKAGLYDFASGSFKTSIRLNETDEIEHTCIDWKNRCFLTYSIAVTSDTAYEELRCYSIDTGDLIASAVVPEKEYGFSTPVLLDDLGILCMYGTDEGEKPLDSEPYIYYWDYLGGYIDGAKEYFDRQHSVSHKLKNYAASLEDKYGIYFYLGYDVLVSDFAYELEVCTDDELMYKALQKVEKVLESYPDNFFRQIKTGNARTLGIYLCQGLVEKEEGLATDAIAFSSGVEYERSIVLDVDYEKELMRTVYHEISHWIDNYIADMNQFGICPDYEENWQRLNPEGFQYLNSYENYSKRTEYTYFTEKNHERVYFIDAYSTTTGGEDRARLFEFLMEEDAQNFYRCPHLIEKLDYRFKVIREAFDTTGWPARTSWEMKLDEWKNRAGKE